MPSGSDQGLARAADHLHADGRRPGVEHAEGASRADRDVDDPSARERPAIVDRQHGPAFVREVRDENPRAERQRGMRAGRGADKTTRRGTPATGVKGGATRLNPKASRRAGQSRSRPDQARKRNGLASDHRVGVSQPEVRAAKRKEVPREADAAMAERGVNPRAGATPKSRARAKGRLRVRDVDAMHRPRIVRAVGVMRRCRGRTARGKCRGDNRADDNQGLLEQQFLSPSCFGACAIEDYWKG